MSHPPSIAVSSWAELQERVTAIVAALNANTSLTLASAANPFAALEELGYEVTPEAKAEIEDRLRFLAREAAERRRLRSRVFEEAGREFDLSSTEELGRVLYEDLQITPYPDERGCYPPQPDPRPVRKRIGGDPDPDPLAALEGRHPILAPLLEYRRLEASRAPFAPREAFEAILRGEVTGGLRELRVRLKGEAGERDDGEGPPSPSSGPEGTGRRVTTAGTEPSPTPRREAPRSPGGHGEGRPTRRRAHLIDVNRATAEELTALPGVGPTLAARIVAERDASGPYKSADSLRRVLGIKARLVAKLQPHITTSS